MVQLKTDDDIKKRQAAERLRCAVGLTDTDQMQKLIDDGNRIISDYWYWKDDHDYMTDDLESAEDALNGLKDIFKEMLLPLRHCRGRLEKIINVA